MEKGVTSWSRYFILTVLPLLILILIGKSDGSIPYKSSSVLADDITSEENSKFRAVPLMHPDAYNPFNPRSILSYPNEKENISLSKSDSDHISHSKLLNTKSIPFVVTKHGLLPTPAGSKLAINPFDDCFFKNNCPETIKNDAWYRFHSVLNSRLKPGPLNDVRNKLEGALEYEPLSFGKHMTKTASIPFVVQRKHSKLDPTSIYPKRTRHTRTTTPSADLNWVKLEPLPPGKTYDPFKISKNGSSLLDSSSSTSFASRQGVELDPESFAERHGWKNGKYGGNSGTWIEDLNLQNGGYGNNRRHGHEPQRPNFNIRDDERWVKLEAVPVAGVKISKWVPKNTAPSELPSTSWKYPNKISSSPSWWDRIDDRNHNFGRPPFQHSFPSSHLSKGWPSRYPQRHTHSSQSGSDAWSDVIYPNNNPLSATASWVSDKHSGNRGVGWNKSHGSRYPVASWSANTNKNRQKYPNRNAYPFQQPTSFGSGKPLYYPDPDGKPNDKQWVLISSSKNKQPNSPYGASSNNYASYEEFPYAFYNHRNSKGLNFTKLNKGSEPGIPARRFMTQDELFKRTNATLYSLKPALNHRNPTTERPPVNLIDMLTSTAANIIESTTNSYYGNHRTRKTTPSLSTSGRPETPPPARKKRLLGKINTAAAVGAGMIPTTFGSVLPMFLGGKKRKRSGNYGENQNDTQS